MNIHGATQLPSLYKSQTKEPDSLYYSKWHLKAYNDLDLDNDQYRTCPSYFHTQQ